ncbi:MULTISPECIES: adenosine kinase [unclassified Aureimonas]|uniref:adenosine kinase n=1 Tax=unclassified Aureimonas TaxID=2615206 RepID=UPI0006F6E7B5|nr:MULTISPECIES: adenosine kinase [unclassified Aureimonas]KQT55403.1 carbohydrate kinase [Aureimonas sp. Leaf427]KQT71151.1 carbohydrate kinase [Aureimonas sp. Leaf460]
MIQYDVLTIGNAIVDIIARTDNAFLEEQGIPKGSMTLIDTTRAQSLYNAMGPAVEMSGGSAANTAAGVVSLGGTAGYIGKVCDDQLGAIFTHDIRALGIAFQTAPLSTGPATARSMILVTPDGERSMNTYLGACVELSPDDIDEELVAAAKVTYFEGYLWDPPLAKDAIRKAASIAHANGRDVAITLSDSYCVYRYRAEFLDLMRSSAVDIVFANEAEVLALYETKNFDAALTQLAADVRKFGAVTRGEKGCVVVEGKTRIDVPATEVSTVVDTTGAGDLFAAGFLRGYTGGLSKKVSAQLGVVAAGQIIAQIGPRFAGSIRDTADVSKLLGVSSHL